jgi:hypothetical protein
MIDSACLTADNDFVDRAGATQKAMSDELEVEALTVPSFPRSYQQVVNPNLP